MHRPSSTDAAMIGTVNAHLAQLSSLTSFDVGEARLQVASASLRYLLVEGMLARAWRASRLGGPLTLRAWCIDAMQGDNAVAFCGGGDVLPGVPFSVCFNATLAERSLDLAAFCRSARIQAGTTAVSTMEVVQYVANTLGGAHFDPDGTSPRSRKPVFQLLRRIEDGALGGLSLRLNNRGLLHHEILSIAQVIARSPEVVRLGEWRPTIG